MNQGILSNEFIYRPLNWLKKAPNCVLSAEVDDMFDFEPENGSYFTTDEFFECLDEDFEVVPLPYGRVMVKTVNQMDDHQSNWAANKIMEALCRQYGGTYNADIVGEVFIVKERNLDPAERLKVYRAD